jgi:hypothetical protein
MREPQRQVRVVAGVLASALLLIAADCGDKSPLTTISSLSPQATPAPTATTAATARRTARTFHGQFYVTPRPDAAGQVHIEEGDTVEVNAAQIRDDTGEGLMLTVDWGDGTQETVACGPCRAQHTFAAGGLYSLKAVIADGDRTLDLTLAVKAKFCHSVSFNLAGPGAISAPCSWSRSRFCDDSPITATSASQAREACEACPGPCTDNGSSWSSPTLTSYVYATNAICPTQKPGDIAVAAGASILPCQTLDRWAP